MRTAPALPSPIVPRPTRVVVVTLPKPGTVLHGCLSYLDYPEHSGTWFSIEEIAADAGVTPAKAKALLSVLGGRGLVEIKTVRRGLRIYRAPCAPQLKDAAA